MKESNVGMIEMKKNGGRGEVGYIEKLIVWMPVVIRRFHKDFLWFAFFSVFPVAAASQTPSPVGGEFQINTYTSSSQGSPSVGLDGAGGFVVVWYGFIESGTDTSGQSVHGQRFTSDGIPVGGEFQVNSYTSGHQYSPSVGPDGSGGFVVVWDSRGSYGSDSYGRSIQGQRYSSTGSPSGEQFQVNSYTSSWFRSPNVSLDGSGGFVVVWEGYGSYGSDNDGMSIHGQRYTSDGEAAGGEFQVNTFSTGRQMYSSVALDGSGGFVVVWDSQGSSGTDIDGSSIQGQRFGSDGLEVGSEFQINTYTTSHQDTAHVNNYGNDGFMVFWVSEGSYGDDSDGDSIHGQLFTSSGDEVGVEFQVNTYTTADQRRPVVVVEDSRDFIVIWDSRGSDTDQDKQSVQGRLFTSNGVAVGEEFQVNTYTTLHQFVPAVSSDGAGGFVVVWESNGSYGSDPNSSIQGQRMSTVLVFENGFESGDTSAWSSTMP